MSVQDRLYKRYNRQSRELPSWYQLAIYVMAGVVGLVILIALLLGAGTTNTGPEVSGAPASTAPVATLAPPTTVPTTLTTFPATATSTPLQVNGMVALPLFDGSGSVAVPVQAFEVASQAVLFNSPGFNIAQSKVFSLTDVGSTLTFDLASSSGETKIVAVSVSLELGQWVIVPGTLG